MKYRPITLAACLLAALCAQVGPAAAADASPAPVEPIAALDVPRYMGTWYEIARYPNWFQKKCAGDSRADYSLLESGEVRVVNRCREADGKVAEAVGLARQLGAADSPRLEVRFAPAWLSFLPMVWGDYWVLDLDPDYRLVAVGEPSREYLWILSRTPTVDARAYSELLERLAARGFDVDRLVRGEQGGGEYQEGREGERRGKRGAQALAIAFRWGEQHPAAGGDDVRFEVDEIEGGQAAVDEQQRAEEQEQTEFAAHQRGVLGTEIEPVQHQPQAVGEDREDLHGQRRQPVGIGGKGPGGAHRPGQHCGEG